MNVVSIIADHREAASGVIRALEQDPLVNLTVRQLEFGDFEIGNGVVVERKSANDAVSSILDKRVFRQVDAAKEAGVKMVVLLEGDPFSVSSAITKEALAGFLSYLTCYEGIPITPVPHVSITPLMLRTMAAHQQFGLIGGSPSLRPATPKSPRDRQTWAISALPGIGEGRAEALLDHFGTPAKVFSASVAELCSVPGIGVKTARTFRSVLDEPA